MAAVWFTGCAHSTELQQPEAERALYISTINVTFLLLFEQGALYFHFELSATNYVPGPDVDGKGAKVLEVSAAFVYGHSFTLL